MWNKSDRKTNAIWFHLYVESKKPNKKTLLTIENKVLIARKERWVRDGQNRWQGFLKKYIEKFIILWDVLNRRKETGSRSIVHNFHVHILPSQIPLKKNYCHYTFLQYNLWPTRLMRYLTLDSVTKSLSLIWYLLSTVTALKHFPEESEVEYFLRAICLSFSNLFDLKHPEENILENIMEIKIFLNRANRYVKQFSVIFHVWKL